MEPADAQYEVGVVAPSGEDTHLSFESEGEDLRVEDAGEQPKALLVELDGADERYLENKYRRLCIRQDAFQHAENCEVAGYLDDDTERQRDQRRRAPTELRHWPEEELPVERREDRFQVADDAGRVLHHVVREQDVRHCACAYAVREGLQAYGAVES